MYYFNGWNSNSVFFSEYYPPPRLLIFIYFLSRIFLICRRTKAHKLTRYSSIVLGLKHWVPGVSAGCLATSHCCIWCHVCVHTVNTFERQIAWKAIATSLFCATVKSFVYCCLNAVSEDICNSADLLMMNDISKRYHLLSTSNPQYFGIKLNNMKLIKAYL